MVTDVYSRASPTRCTDSSASSIHYFDPSLRFTQTKDSGTGIIVVKTEGRLGSGSEAFTCRRGLVVGAVVPSNDLYVSGSTGVWTTRLRRGTGPVCVQWQTPNDHVSCLTVERRNVQL